MAAYSQLEPTRDSIAVDWLHAKLGEIEAHIGCDALTSFGPIQGGVEHRVRYALEALDERRPCLLVIVHTLGGVVEVGERIVTTLRHYYQEVRFAVPDRAMSAGAVLVMSGDAILMDHFSCLGPVDPQLPKDDRLVPALSYLEMFERLKERAEKGELTTAEIVLLERLDLAELHQYELAGELSVKLIRDWLVRYKFKNWRIHNSTGAPVTNEEKEARAREIAEALSNHTLWGSHGRGINRETLRSLRLEIDDLDADARFSELVAEYFRFFTDLMSQLQVVSCIHSRRFL